MNRYVEKLKGIAENYAKTGKSYLDFYDNFKLETLEFDDRVALYTHFYLSVPEEEISI